MGQLTGRFYLQKETYAPGEPVFLYFEAKNDGSSGENVTQANPYSFCSGYQIRVSTDPSPDSVCVKGFAGSCLSSDVVILPGKSRTERILLNYEHSIDAPGAYDVEATRHLSYADSKLDFFSASKTVLEVRQQLHFRIDDNATPNPDALQDLVARLRSQDAAARVDAARELATLGPRSLETVLLGFAAKEEFRQFSPLAFHKLNTARSMSAMAELLVNSKPGTYEHMESARYLAESGDPQWFPLLLEVARKNARISNYVADAAQSGGEQALPFLVELTRSPDKEFSVLNAVMALGYTGSRAAVPILLELLRSPEAAISQRALGGLRQLTHVRLQSDPWGENSQAQYGRWAQWWARSQSTARIYKPTECADFASLP
jgi:hypothetical protein